MFGNGKCFPADGKVPCANRYAYTVAYTFHALYFMYVDCFANDVIAAIIMLERAISMLRWIAYLSYDVICIIMHNC